MNPLPLGALARLEAAIAANTAGAAVTVLAADLAAVLTVLGRPATPKPYLQERRHEPLTAAGRADALRSASRFRRSNRQDITCD